MFQDFKTEIRLLLIVFIVGIIVVVGGIFLLKTLQLPPIPSPSPNPNIQTFSGRVKFVELEGGCWYLQVPAKPGPLEDIAKLGLSGVSEEELAQYQNKEVEVKGFILEDIVSICQVGPMLEVKEIDLVPTDESDVSGWQTYRNEEYGFEVKYPVEGKLLEGQWDDYSKRIDLPLSKTGTNLLEKYMLVHAVMRQDCSNLGQVYIQSSESVRVNGIEFKQEIGGGVGGGNIYSSTAYSREKDGKCVGVTFVLHSGNIGAYSDPSPEEFDHENESEIFSKIFSMFRFVEE